jgi:hypothetical protein
MKTLVRAFISPLFVITLLSIGIILTVAKTLPYKGLTIAVACIIQLIIAMATSSKAGTYTRPKELIKDSLADAFRFGLCSLSTLWWYDWSSYFIHNQSNEQFYSVIILLFLTTLITMYEGYLTLKVGTESLYRQNPVNINP